jgi:hypothetical protein
MYQQEDHQQEDHQQEDHQQEDREALEDHPGTLQRHHLGHPQYHSLSQQGRATLA